MSKYSFLSSLRIVLSIIVAVIIIPAMLLQAWQPVYGAGATSYYDPTASPPGMQTSPDTTLSVNDPSIVSNIWTTGWYVVDQSGMSISGRIVVQGDVNLILADGCSLTASSGITVSSGNSLTIYAQSGSGGSLGALTANGTGATAGIGGNGSSAATANAGTITINGGNIHATGGDMGAGIGGSGSTDGKTLGTGGNITINFGAVTATGGNNHGAGIGGGGNSDGGNITITGGFINATGGAYGAAGIGGGGPWLQAASDSAGAGGTIIISGGSITATGNSSAYGGGAGIGGGGGGNPDKPGASGDITITGSASVTATGGGGGHDGNVNLPFGYTGGGGGAAIGSGGGDNANLGPCGNIYIGSGVTLNLTPGNGQGGANKGASVGYGGNRTSPAGADLDGTDLIPSAPQNLTAAGGISQATLNWDFSESVPSTTGWPISGFVVRYSTDGGNTWTNLGNIGSATLYTVQNLTNGTTYQFQVAAVNQTNSSSGPYNWSNIASATPQAVAPDAPTGLSVSTGDRQATASFTPPSFDGGSAITSYTVIATPDGGTTKITNTGTASPITLAGLTNGTQYSFTVTATNEIGTSPASAAVSGTPSTTPFAPTGVSAIPGDKKITLSWSAPSDGGSAILSYEYSTDGGTTWAPITGSGAQSTSAEITTLSSDGTTALANGTAYDVSVRAVNANGPGPGSAPVSATPVTVPGAPAILSATSGDSQVEIAFSAPGSDGGSPITSYTVTATPDNGITIITNTGAGSPIVISGLTNGTPYSFTVTAVNAVGSGSPSDAITATPYGPPSAPQNVTASAGDTQATVSFSPPSSDGGDNTLTYTVTATVSGGGSSISVSGTSSPITVPGLTNGTTYAITVTAKNSMVNSEGPASSPAVNVTPAGLPSAPVNLTAAAGNAQVTLSWTTPPDGGSPILSYKYSTDGGQTWRTIQGSGAATTNATITTLSSDGTTPLNNGTAYTLELCAVNAAGAGPSASAAATPLAPPTVPSDAQVTADNGQVTATFTPQTGNGTITYTLTATPVDSSGNPTGPPITNTGTDSPLTLTGLANGTAYNITLTATNAAGDSTSTSMGTETPATTPSAPQNVSVTYSINTSTNPNSGDLLVAFSPPASDGGSAITSYTVVATPIAEWDTVLETMVPIVDGTPVTVSGTASPITVTGLMVETLYDIVVYATNSVGPGAAAATQVFLATVPSSPMYLIATPAATTGGPTINMSWQTPADDGGSPITGYEYSTNGGANKMATPGSDPLALSATITTDSTGMPLKYATTYPVCVHADNIKGTGPASEVVYVIIYDTPVAPTNLTSVPGNAQVSLSWEAPANSAASGIKSYEYSTDGGTNWTAIPGSSASTTTYTVTLDSSGNALANGTSYTFAVRAIGSATGAAATGVASNTVTATPFTKPSAPTSPVVTTTGTGATVTFTPSSSTGGNGNITYTVTAIAADGTTITASGTTSPLTLSGLDPGTSYNITVSADNGSGPVTSNPIAVTTKSVPSAPQNVSAAAGNGQITVSFSPPASDGGSAVTLYTVKAAPAGGGSATTITGTTSPVTVTGLSNGTAYTISVTATNSVGEGPAATAASNVTPIAPPSAPQTVAAAAGNRQIIVSFTAPAQDGGSAVTSYTVTAMPSNGGAAVTATGSASPITVTGLTNGTTYTISVTAANAAGTSPASSPAVSVTPASVPSVPQNVSAAPGNTQATVSFTPPALDGGSPITGYTVTVTPGNQIFTGSSSPIIVTGLTNGTLYTFSVTATNAAGTGPPVTATCTPAGPPAAPTGVSATAGNAQATVSFTAPASNGSPITTYTVTATPASGPATPQTALGATSPITVSGLTNGTAYSFTVTATNAAGTSPPSASSATVTPAAPPSSPTGVSVSAGNAQAIISFTAPASNGGSPITSYRVTVSPGGQTFTGTNSPITVTGLTNGTAYTFSITATNSAGTSPASTASGTPLAPPTVPRNVSAAAGNTQAIVTFTAPASNGGSPVTSYTVTATGGGQTITQTGTNSPITVTGLTNGTAYSISVTATNSQGNSPASPQLNGITPGAPPSAPLNVTATPGSSMVTVAFDAPASDGGTPITTYTITVMPGARIIPCSGGPINVTGLTNGTNYTFSVTATNATGTGPAAAASAIPAAHGITTNATLPPTVDSAAYYQQLNYYGSAVSSWVLISGALPPGLDLDPATGIISGIPTDPGTYIFTITATAADGATDTKTFTLVVNAPVVQIFGTWTGSGTVSAVILADIADFERLIRIGSRILVDPSYYTITSGSTIITFTEAYLLTLPNGTYNYIAEFRSQGIYRDYDTTPIMLTIDRPNNPNDPGYVANRGGAGEGGTGEGGNGAAPATGDREPLLLYFAMVFLSISLIIVSMLSLVIDQRPKKTFTRV